MQRMLAVLLGGLMLLDLSGGAAFADQTVRLANGLTVLVREDERFPLVSMRLYVHAGSAYERPEEAGISHLLEHMAFKGSEHFPSGELAKAIERVGGYLNASTSFDNTVYVMDLPDSAWEIGLTALRDMAFGLTLDPAEVEREKKVVLAELDRGEDNPDRRLFKMIQKSLWPGTSYEWPVIGHRETVERLTATELRAYVRRLYQPQSMLLVVVGRVKTADILTRVEALFGSAANDRIVPRTGSASLPASGVPRIAVARGAYKKAYLTLAFPLPELRSPDTAPADVLTHLLGGDQTAKLYRKYKYEKRMVDTIAVSAVNLERAGALYASVTLDAERLPEFWPELLADLAALDVREFTDEELGRASLLLEDSLHLAKETLPGLASKIGHFQFFEGGPEAEANYLSSVRYVTRAELDQVVKGYIRPDRLSVAVLLPENATVAVRDLEDAVSRIWPIGKSAARSESDRKSGPEVLDLGQGSRLVLIPDPTMPYMAVNVSRRGGDALLSAQEQGLAELTARSATRGVPGLDAKAVQEFLAARAAGVGVSSGRDSFEIGAKFPSRFAPDILDYLRRLLAGPSFAAEEVGRARADQIAAISRQEDQPTGLAFRHLFPLIYGDSPYGYMRLGRPEVVSGLTDDAVRAFWAKQTAYPFVMSVCGDFDRESVVAFAREQARTGGGVRFRLPTPHLSAAGRELDLKLTDRNQAHLFRIFPVPGLGDPDGPGLNLLEAVLSGQGGLLFRELRDGQGLGYSVTAMLWQAPGAGLLIFYIGTGPDKLDQADAAFRKAVADLAARDLPVAELERGKNQLRGDYYRGHQSLASRSREAAANVVRDLPTDWSAQVIGRAEALQPADLRRLAARLLRWDKSYVLKVTP